MALVDMEGFDKVSTTTQFNRIRQHFPAGGSVISSSGGPYQGASMTFPSVSSGGIILQNYGAQDRIITGALVRFPDSISSTTILRIYGDSSTQGQIETDGSGNLFFTRGTFTDVGINQDATDNFYNRIMYGVWHWIEIDITVANAGSVDVYIDGVLAMTGTGDTQNEPDVRVERVYWWGSSTSDHEYAAAYLMDTTGTVNTARLGPFDIEAVTPDGDGTTNDFTPLSGLTNYEMVDDATPDDATTYVSSTTLNHKDLYTHSALTSDWNDVYAVQVNALMRKMSGGERLMRMLARSVATETESAAFGPSIDWSGDRQIIEQDPNGPTDWTVSAVNAAEFGVTIEA